MKTPDQLFDSDILDDNEHFSSRESQMIENWYYRHGKEGDVEEYENSYLPEPFPYDMSNYVYNTKDDTFYCLSNHQMICREELTELLGADALQLYQGYKQLRGKKQRITKYESNFPKMDYTSSGIDMSEYVYNAHEDTFYSLNTHRKISRYELDCTLNCDALDLYQQYKKGK